ncbi:MAG: alcohol dehydrogenase catalytic domain-containing protein [Victivallales bacterium]|nr:alcohol dehydrogenase catalytic domain-containing protein [Victivallales bacterium]
MTSLPSIPTSVCRLQPCFAASEHRMRAAVLLDYGNLVLREVARPKPVLPGQVLVQIRACGVCATDEKAISGTRRNVTFPMVPGHEPSGVVAEVGPGVEHFAVGDEVICQPSGYCGFCTECRLGRTHYCEHAFTTGGDGPDEVWPGAFAEYMLTTETCLFRKPAGVSFAAAAITEPLSGAWKGLIQYSEMKVGDDVVIIGTGGIGLLCLMMARAAGAGRLIAVDPSPHAREIALRLGATHAVDPFASNARDRVYAVLPDGPDVVLEAAGPIEAVRLMVSLLRRGTRWNVFGITTHETFELDGGLAHFLEARMDASFGTTPLAMQNAIRLMERGLVDPEQIITAHFPLEQLSEALDAMRSPEHNKIIIEP